MHRSSAVDVKSASIKNGDSKSTKFSITTPRIIPAAPDLDKKIDLDSSKAKSDESLVQHVQVVDRQIKPNRPNAPDENDELKKGDHILKDGFYGLKSKENAFKIDTMWSKNVDTLSALTADSTTDIHSIKEERPNLIPKIVSKTDTKGPDLNENKRDRRLDSIDVLKINSKMDSLVGN